MTDPAEPMERIDPADPIDATLRNDPSDHHEPTDQPDPVLGHDVEAVMGPASVPVPTPVKGARHPAAAHSWHHDPWLPGHDVARELRYRRAPCAS
jgi:hypothetical protein